jgi:hypothetical protein
MATRAWRWTIRVLGWTIAPLASLAAVALLVFATYLFLSDYEETLRRRLETELSSLSGGRASITSIDLTLSRFAFELNGVSVLPETGDPQAEPILEVRRVFGRLRLVDALRLRIHWAELEVEGLAMRVEPATADAADADSDSDAIRFPLELGGAKDALSRSSGISVSADNVSVVDSTLILHDRRVPWTLEANGLNLQMERQWTRGLRGALSLDDGRLQLDQRDAVTASLRATFDWLEPEIFLNAFEATSDLGSATAKGKLSLTPSGPQGRFELTLEASPSATARFSALPVALDGEPVRLRGGLDVSPEGSALQGTILWNRGRVGSAPLSGLRAELFWDDQLFQISSARALLAGGVLQVQLDQPLPASEHDASLELNAQGISPGSLFDSQVHVPLSTRVSGRASLSFPIESPRRVSGPFEMWGEPSEPSEPSTSSAVELEEERESRFPRQAFEFRARGSLVDGDVEIAEGSFSTPTLAGTIDGVYPREAEEEAALVLDIRSEDLRFTDHLQRDLRRMLRGEEESRSRPALWGVTGTGSARGRLLGRLPHLRYHGVLVAEGLFFEGVDWGRVRADGRISRDEIVFENLSVEHDDARVTGKGRVALAGPLGRRDFDVDVSLASWPSADLNRLFGSPEAEVLSGPVSGRLTARRREGSLSGSAEVELTDGALFGEKFDTALASFVLDGTEVTAKSVEVLRGDSPLRGAIGVDVASGALSGSLSAERFPLRYVIPRAASTTTTVRRTSSETESSPRSDSLIGGLVSGELEISGRIVDPVARFRGRVAELRLEDELLGDAEVQVDLLGKRIQIDVSLVKGVTTAALSAEVLRDADLSTSARIRWSELDAAPWLFSTGSAPAGAGDLDLRVLSNGEARLSGGLHRPWAMDGEATLGNVIVEGDAFRVVSLSPVELTLRDGRLSIQSFQLARGSSRIEIGGAARLDEGVVDLQVDGSLSMAVVEILYPSLATTGEMSLLANVRGPWQAPSFSGHADLQGGSIRLEEFPQTLGDLRGRLQFDNRMVRFEDVRGVFGTGPVGATGVVSWERDGLSSLELNFTGSDVRLRYPDGLVATLDFDLGLVGTSAGQVLSGRIDLDDAIWSREYELVSGILSDREGMRLFEELAEEPLLSGIRFDVQVRADDSLRVRNALANIDATAELELRGSVAEPALLGETEAERGDVFFLGQRYTITSGRVDFVDPAAVQPFVDLTAETRVRSYRVELRLTGTPERFFPELTSDPPLPTVGILRLLAGATERDLLDPLGTEEEELAGVGVASLLTERLSQEVGRRAERLFGLDRFSIDPFLVGRFANPTARVSLGKQIRRDLSINYSTNLNSTTEAIVLIEYTPEGPMSWILSRDEEGDVGIDVKFRRSF